ncbi:sigma-54 interaction domain-containing protein [Cohnella kolymensis]|uniref:sigma-54 interaction domain-containing protein n=1 Tax=Cohnella kolymensis TaxID=1590652 RepID=UPI00069651FD|nr:sigma 54-interacting transcriptional regulator [Cohnella kolymensis]
MSAHRNSDYSEFEFTKAKAVQLLYEQVDQVAQFDSNVLVLGESGVGKEVVVQRIHEKSPRRNGPFVRINCGAIPENLMESEMFGYAEGVFSGVKHQGKLGLISLANRGTLFLDEIAELTLPIQGKLLRVIQERHFYPIDSVEAITVDIRVITATSRNLRSLIESGKFREELYHRLNVVPIKVPSLRERREDIPGFIDFFVNYLNRKYSKRKIISASVVNVLMQYQWPGNIRELKNLVERLVVTSRENLIDIYDIPPEILDSIEENRTKPEQAQRSLREMLEGYEYDIIKEAVRRHKTLLSTSTELGIDVSTLSRKCKKYNIKLQG